MKLRHFFDHPLFVAANADAVRAARDTLPTAVRDGARVVFTAHSVPTAADAAAGTPAEGGRRYSRQVAEAARLVAAELGLTEWDVVWQSRSGPPTQPWLDPDVNDVIAALPDEGVTAVAVVPLGFVSDHMEVLWDLDTEAMETSAEVGIVALRAPTPGVDPAYVSGLVDLILERVDGTPPGDRPHETELGPWYDVCRPGCCENVRLGFKPAISGIAP